jgi:hypothetical protein
MLQSTQLLRIDVYHPAQDHVEGLCLFAFCFGRRRLISRWAASLNVVGSPSETDGLVYRFAPNLTASAASTDSAKLGAGCDGGGSGCV